MKNDELTLVKNIKNLYDKINSKKEEEKVLAMNFNAMQFGGNVNDLELYIMRKILIN